MELPAPFSQAFVDDCFYSPEVFFFDRIEELDAAQSRIVCRMDTNQPMPFTDHQRADPHKHPRHVNGAVMIQLTGMLGFVHAYHLEGLRHGEGWVGFGTHIHKAVFRKLVSPGDPMFCAVTQLRARKGKARMFSTYKFEFRHQGAVAYESEQNAMWINVNERPLSAGLL